MIARTHRFHGFNALRSVYANGRTVRGPLMATRFQPNDRRGSYRAAVVVSRKIHKSAVVRNRIRRRIYEILRRHESQITRPYDIVITVFSDGIAAMPAPELEAALTELLTRAGIVARYSDKSHEKSPQKSDGHALKSSPQNRPENRPKNRHDIVVPKENQN